MLVSGEIRGGLGNQLFIICTTIAYSIKHACSYAFRYGTVSPSCTPRRTYWDCILQHIPTINGVLPEMDVYKESGFTFESIPRFTKDTMLDGYYQSYKYFADEFQEISKLMQLDTLRDAVRSKYSAMLEGSTVSLHFRLSDYSAAWRLPLSYYESALANFQDQAYNVIVFYEESDTETVNGYVSQLKEKYPNLNFKHIDCNIPDYEQMLLMSCCNHNVIANSSFSWWGAYFGAESSKRIVYPQRWFPGYDSRDVCPPEWIAAPV
jgi:hypothetical protein